MRRYLLTVPLSLVLLAFFAGLFFRGGLLAQRPSDDPPPKPLIEYTTCSWCGGVGVLYYLDDDGLLCSRTCTREICHGGGIAWELLARPPHILDDER